MIPKMITDVFLVTVSVTYLLHTLTQGLPLFDASTKDDKCEAPKHYAQLTTEILSRLQALETAARSLGNLYIVNFHIYAQTQHNLKKNLAKWLIDILKYLLFVIIYVLKRRPNIIPKTL